MSATQIQEDLKNMSGDEIAQTQHAIMVHPDLSDGERALAMGLVGHEVQTRQDESLGRKAGRLWNRHGEKIGLLAIGALVGDFFGD